jgi:hypothetical protein
MQVHYISDISMLITLWLTGHFLTSLLERDSRGHEFFLLSSFNINDYKEKSLLKCSDQVCECLFYFTQLFVGGSDSED